MISTKPDQPREGLREFPEPLLEMELLRFTTAGSVDDGKSTLIGRLLHDSKAVYEDQLASVKKSRINRSSGPIDFSLLTDGLRAEREQGITIDVAYRYFATTKRKFIIADTPGHEQYTRNMATGASTADLAVILVDATKGILPQTRRHAFIASLLGIRNVLAAVNKMDLVAYREEVFLNLQRELLELAQQLGVSNVQCIPISALEGDNVVDKSARTPWYQGPTLLEHLETIPLGTGESPENLRFPVQLVIRPDAAFRGFAGQLAGGVIRPGDEVLALPSGQKSRVRAIASYDGDLDEAFAPMSVTLQLEDEIDLSRGDMLVATENGPRVAKRFRAMVVWLHEAPLELERTYLVKHTARQTKIRAWQIRHRVNTNSLEHEAATQLNRNEIGSVEFEAHVALFFDAYARNRTTGSFILIDAITNATVGAGMIEGGSAEWQTPAGEFATLGTPADRVTAPERFQRHGHHAATFLLRGRPALASRLERALFAQGFEALHLSSDEISGDQLPGAAHALHRLGAVVIYSGEAPEETRQQLLSQVKKGFFDLSTKHDNAAEEEISDEEILARAVALARILKYPRLFDQQEEGT